jgi:hypothetical protein
MQSDASEPTRLPEGADRVSKWLLRMVARPRLAARLALIAVLLSSSSLLMGFYLDDFVGRYIYSQLDGARRLYDLYAGGYGLANGNPADNHWQIEAGWAPWWIHDQLLIRLYRPLGELSHWLDSRLWPHAAVPQHLHSLFWLALLVLAVTRMYRVLLGSIVGGLAALLFALDHTHGFVVGYICNRHALITAMLGVLALAEHVRAEECSGAQRLRRKLVAAGAYFFAMMSGESTIAIGGYLFAYALFAQRGSLATRALSFAPYALITLGWRVAYNVAGYGASGSGLYVDPVRQPLAFLAAFVERAPVLILGQFLMPPSEIYVVSGALVSGLIFGAALIFLVALGFALVPLLRTDRLARFWAVGALLSLVPAASTYPHNRQLLFTSLGAMALIAQLWQLHILQPARAPAQPPRAPRSLRFSRELGAGLLFMHLIVSPLALPFTTCSIVFARSLQRAPESVGDELAGRDAVFITAPDYFAVRLVQLERRIEHKPLPRRIRALAFGEEPVTVFRTDDQTLELSYGGGILSTPFMELYRDRDIPMHPGQRIALAGLVIEVLEVTADGRVSRARFRFDLSLDSDQLVFYHWSRQGFVQLDPPRIGQSRSLPPARLELGLD